MKSWLREQCLIEEEHRDAAEAGKVVLNKEA